MVEGEERLMEGEDQVVDWRKKIGIMVKALGPVPVADVLGVDEETVNGLLSGEVSMDAGMELRLSRMDGLYREPLEWSDDQAYGPPMLSAGDPAPGVSVLPLEPELVAEAGVGPSGGLEGALGGALMPAVPAVVEATRTWSWQEHMDERRKSLRAIRELVQMVQYRLDLSYQGQVAMLGLVAKIELAMIYLGETLPEAGMDWDGDRKLREQHRRQSRLIWVRREQNREYGGMRGVMNWLMGRQRPSAKELIQRMIAEADNSMGVLPELGEGNRLQPGEERHAEEMVRYMEAAEVIDRGREGPDVVEGGGEGSDVVDPGR